MEALHVTAVNLPDQFTDDLLQQVVQKLAVMKNKHPNIVLYA